MSKRALITGVTGQDGAYLAKFLIEKGYEVFGTYRRLSSPNFWRLQSLNIADRINLIPADLLDGTSIVEAMEISKPDEIYNLAAQSFVGASFEQPIGTGEITGLGTMRVLEAIRQVNPKVRMYQASTSELYGNVNQSPQNEDVPFHPVSPYAAAKLYGYWTVKIYREGYNIFACNGILFNHESPLRGLEFVTRKISNAVAKIALGIDNIIEIGNLDAKRDWGYAPEYVESMWLILQQDKPDDFVIATNESHSVKEFMEKAFSVVNLDWQKYVKINKKYNRPLDINLLLGDASKAKNKLGWEPKVKFDQLVEIMVKEDLLRWERFKKGEHFPWDASNYMSETKILTRSLKT
ncbi:GDP-mannose 4,6-dehydratase [Candidatus Saganbacteria bacterium CG08_land_8_20_14_0_20_45_16]|uniref:GDP-mannose 4,6-dehydratase n=1 Tax=Candidatus Saganbacteria bacterium CG08_land_8_20_14_0_20_45_16 TaxID=2014293 RepID=A0A2H0XZB2_UNCSA|nr:MAG: GDP-mannose 4,6-dehydratase [Candidatus Saganbacteria bacterium CG08_land_8_20_14_0_20_45_16]